MVEEVRKLKEQLVREWPEGKYKNLEIDAFLYQYQLLKNKEMGIKDLKERLTWFKKGSMTYKKPGSSAQVKTLEGTAAVEDAIEYLENLGEYNPYQFNSPDLVKSARFHADWCSSSGGVSHDSPLTGTSEERIRRVIKEAGEVAENIGVNLIDATGRDIILQLVIDDGVKT